MTRLKHIWTICLVLLSAVSINGQQTPRFDLSLSSQDITVLTEETVYFQVLMTGQMDETAAKLSFIPQHDDLISIDPTTVNLLPELTSYNISILGLKPGHLEVFSNYSSNENPNDQKFDNLFMRVTVAISNAIIIISNVVGWVYFVAWSVSFYPQILYNFQRKSVVGLNFDFLALNIVGFIMYSIFNIGLYWIPEIEAEYFARNPRGLNPVLINDVVFAIHAALATIVTIAQCFVYERAEQRVSLVARGILGAFGICVIIFFILVATKVFHWLDFLYACSYIKLTITLIKYIPQALMNYRRKSTVGWSIGNILLDFTGGILSMLQMILNAYNYDDWDSIFGDPTKFGLGLFSVCFDILFIIQHYILYRNNYQEIEGNNVESSEADVVAEDGNENGVFPADDDTEEE